MPLTLIVGTNSFLADALWSEFPGTSDLIYRGLHHLAPAGNGDCFPAGLGGKGRRPQGIRTHSRRPAPTLAGTSVPELARRGSTWRSRKPRSRRAPAHRPGSGGPGTHAAMAQPETGLSTFSGRIQTGADLWAGQESRGFRIPASGPVVSGGLGSEPKVLGTGSGRMGCCGEVSPSSPGEAAAARETRGVAGPTPRSRDGRSESRRVCTGRGRHRRVNVGPQGLVAR